MPGTTTVHYRSISQRGLDFIKGWEALRLFAYPDPASPLAQQSQVMRRRWGMEPAKGILAELPEEVRELSGAPISIGYGHTGDVRMSDCISEHQADELLRFDLSPVELSINNLGIEFTQSQFDALCSICFNVGSGILMPHRSLGQALRGQGRLSVGEAILLYDHAGGRKVEGLTRRREAEKALYETPDTEIPHA